MNKCTDCINGTICKGNLRKGSHANCFQPKPMTNYDRVKNMTIKEMAEFISHFSDGYHTPNQNKKRRKEMKKWLESEVKENDK